MAQVEEARLRAVVDTAVDGVILIDATGAILMFNPACERLFGYDAAEVIGRNVKALMPDSFAREHDAYLRNYRETGVRQIIGIGREVEGRRRDGTTFPMDLSVGEAQDDGAPVFVGVIHDLTERKQSERALRESALRLRAVVDTAVDGVILIDAQGRIQMFNPACERLFGYSVSEVLGENVKMLMPPTFAGEHDRYLHNYRTSGERKIIGIGREVVGRRKDGTTFPMDLSVGEAEQDGEAIFVGVIHDLTERKKTGEQLVQAQKMEAVGQLSGGIAHDFNNLLTVIVGNAEFLEEKLKARPDLEALARAIAGAGERGAELTKRLLAFSRRQMLSPANVDCNQLVGGFAHLLRRTLREDIEIHTRFEGSLPPAFVDQGQLESALLNLALNAQDAMPNGGSLTIHTGLVTLDARYQTRNPEVLPGEYVMLAVTDDGQGMAPDVRARVFEPFFTTKEVGKGSGLGLSMVYGFVKQSSGHVAIYSESGLGTAIRLYFPVGAPAAPPAVRSPDVVERHRGGGTVLVVEDDPFVLSYAVACIEDLSYRVVPARDGHEAMRRLAEENIDLLFTDVVMLGGMSGFELAERVRELMPDLPVLLTSGYALDTLAARGRLPAAAHILDKPYSKTTLARRLTQILPRD